MIKRCPFCGSSAQMMVSYGKHGDFGYISCTMCSARSGKKKLTRDYTVKEWHSNKVFDDPAYKFVLQRWNTRYNEEADYAESDY